MLLPGKSGWWGVIPIGVLWLLVFRQASPVWTVVPQYSYGWFVPLLAGYLGWARWQSRPEPEPGSGGSGSLAWIAVVGLSVFLGLVRLIQHANSDWRLISTLLGASAAIGTWVMLRHAGGGAWGRHFLFPCLFPLIAIPWPTRIEESLVDTFMHVVASVATEIMTHWGVPAIQDGNIITLSNGPVGVDDACSGIQSFQASVMMSLFLGEMLGLGGLARVVLLMWSVGWSFLCNLGRSIFLGFTMHSGGSSALEKAHDPAGYAVMMLSYAGIIGLALWLARGIAVKAATNPQNPCRWLKPAWIVSALAILAFSEIGSELWYRSKEGGRTRRASWSAQIDEKVPGCKVSEFTGVERKVLRFNSASRGEFRNPAGSRWSVAFMKWDGGNLAVDTSKNHDPTICLVGAGYQMETNYVPARIYKVAGLDVPFRRFKFVRGSQALFSFFCVWDDYDQAAGVGRDKEDMWTARARIRNVIHRQRTAGVQVLNAGVFGLEDPEAASREFQELLDKIGKKM